MKTYKFNISNIPVEITAIKTWGRKYKSKDGQDCVFSLEESLVILEKDNKTLYFEKGKDDLLHQIKLDQLTPIIVFRKKVGSGDNQKWFMKPYDSKLNQDELEKLADNYVLKALKIIK